MKAAQISSYGGPSVVQIREVPKPKLQKGQVLAKVYASGLNPSDTGQREGAMKDMVPMELPTTLGGDLAGVVEAVGEGVTSLKVGANVYGQAYSFYGDSGALAEYASVAEEHLANMPDGLDFYQAASLPLVGVSAVQAIEDHIRLQPGQKILIHGGAGSIGALAVRLAKHHRAYVATTASAKDTDFVKSLGADVVIDYQAQNFSEMLKDYDAVIDLVADKDAPIGGDIFRRSLTVLKPGGAIVSLVAYLGQKVIEEAQKRGFKAEFQLTTITSDSLNRLTELVNAGVLAPRIAQEYPLEAIQAAFTERETKNPGKIVIKIR